MRNVERLIEELHCHEVRTNELTVYLSISNMDSRGATVIAVGRFSTDKQHEGARSCIMAALNAGMT